mmetsp:Transcript_10051/g.27539  ORF Transcript_10051/g.27539 Transcript_10051/m.27539 type:complete len:239 (-) Transcript_10051:622-1338(-)
MRCMIHEHLYTLPQAMRWPIVRWHDAPHNASHLANKQKACKAKKLARLSCAAAVSPFRQAWKQPPQQLASQYLDLTPRWGSQLESSTHPGVLSGNKIAWLYPIPHACATGSTSRGRRPERSFALPRVLCARRHPDNPPAECAHTHIPPYTYMNIPRNIKCHAHSRREAKRRRHALHDLDSIHIICGVTEPAIFDDTNRRSCALIVTVIDVARHLPHIRDRTPQIYTSTTLTHNYTIIQ